MLFFDIETEAHPEAVQFIDEPSAPGNYKDPDKIAAYVAEKKAELIDRAALDPDYGRIVAIGYKVDDQPTDSRLVVGGYEEWELLDRFWDLFFESEGVCCGYNIIGFDLPYLLKRSFDLGVRVPLTPDLRKYQHHPTCDLMGILYNWGQAKSLKWVAKRYGLPNPLPDLDGSQVKDMDADTLRAYVENDVNLVFTLYKKMKGVYI